MTFEANAKSVITAIPPGRVATYGQVAALAGNHRGARQVARVLHSSSEKDRLPWHRVITSRGAIALGRGRGFEEQRRRLIREGVDVDRSGRVDLGRFLWEPGAAPSKAAREFLKRLLNEGEKKGKEKRLPAPTAGSRARS